MSTNLLIEKINADTEAQVAKIKAAASAEVTEIERETQKALETLRAEAAAVLAKKEAQQELVATSKAKQEGKLRIQHTKRTELNTLFEQVFDEFVALGTDEYITYFTEQGKAIVPTGIVVKEVRAPQNRVVETAKVLENLGLKSEVTGDDSLKAGFIVVAEDGVYDASFSRIFHLKRPEIEMAVVHEFLN